jgi:hypothetical protein
MVRDEDRGVDHANKRSEAGQCGMQNAVLRGRAYNQHALDSTRFVCSPLFQDQDHNLRPVDIEELGFENQIPVMYLLLRPANSRNKGTSCNASSIDGSDRVNHCCMK